MLKWISKIRPVMAAGLLLAALSACQTTADAANKLSAEEVRATFIDHEWSQGHGTFLFKSDGSYRYTSDKHSPFGTYVMDGEGTICATNASDSYKPGRKTCMTFYRKGGGYEYYHDRSGKYWPATLK